MVIELRGPHAQAPYRYPYYFYGIDPGQRAVLEVDGGLDGE